MGIIARSMRGYLARNFSNKLVCAVSPGLRFAKRETRIAVGIWIAKDTITGIQCVNHLGARHIGGTLVSYSDAAAVALNAGCDMVLLCNQSLDDGSAVDALLDGLAEAHAAGNWQADPDSEARRLDLLPQTAPLTWDALMHQPAYQRALERLP